MSKKRMMSKQQRLYYEYQSKEKIKKELEETTKNLRFQEEKSIGSPFNPHQNSYFS